MKVIIKSIEHQYLLTNSEYRYIKRNLNKPIDVISIFLDRKGKVTTIGVVLYGGRVTTLFIDGNEWTQHNGVKYELVGSLQMSN